MILPTSLMVEPSAQISLPYSFKIHTCMSLVASKTITMPSMSAILVQSCVLFLSLTLALPTAEPTELEPRITGNDASVLLCVQPNYNRCGLYATYINTKNRQSVRAEGFGRGPCIFTLYEKHTNNAGFWVDIDLTGSKQGVSIGYNPTGRSILLDKQTFGSKDKGYLDARCQNEFGWQGVDAERSAESFFGDLKELLY